MTKESAAKSSTAGDSKDTKDNKDNKGGGQTHVPPTSDRDLEFFACHVCSERGGYPLSYRWDQPCSVCGHRQCNLCLRSKRYTLDIVGVDRAGSKK